MSRLRTPDPGEFRHALRLEQPMRVEDDLGGGTDQTWSIVATLYAAIDPLTPSQVFQARQDIERITHRVTMRCRDDVESVWSFARLDRRFLISTVLDPDETRRFLHCYVEEIDP